MNRLCFLMTVALLVLGPAGGRDGHADSGFYKPYGATRSGAAPSSGAGYVYSAPSYRIGLTRTAYRGYADYYGLPRTPYFRHIQPWYQQSHYSYYGFGVPPLGAPATYAGPGRPSLGYVFNPQAYTSYRTGATFHPYTTVSQFVYVPTYVPVISRPYPSTYGVYGRSMFYGY